MKVKCRQIKLVKCATKLYCTNYYNIFLSCQASFKHSAEQEIRRHWESKGWVEVHDIKNRDCSTLGLPLHSSCSWLLHSGQNKAGLSWSNSYWSCAVTICYLKDSMSVLLSLCVNPARTSLPPALSAQPDTVQYRCCATDGAPRNYRAHFGN